jgi:hypothetical protein
MNSALSTNATSAITGTDSHPAASATTIVLRANARPASATSMIRFRSQRSTNDPAGR